ncbi:MAG: LysR family transcriptional regulator, partial [Pseudonocardia sp.]|nr:LysR family transcriptional regulator [Pseudonocardia sp.]
SFVEAARRLGISQSAVSMQIRALEAELGVTLFDRSVRPPLPTPVALAILPTARDVVARVTEIRRVTDAASRPAGLLRLGAISTATLALIPDVLARILRRHPGLGVSVETALSQDLVQRVLDRKLDCAVVTTPEMPPEELRCQAVIRERLVVVAAVGEPVTRLADVATRPFIRYARHQGVGILVGRLLREHGLDPAEFVELDSVESTPGNGRMGARGRDRPRTQSHRRHPSPDRALAHRPPRCRTRGVARLTNRQPARGLTGFGFRRPAIRGERPLNVSEPSA